jgi:hypothetical protein
MVAPFPTATAFADAAEPSVAEKGFPGKFAANVDLTSLVGFDLGLAYRDTDHSDSECSDACGQVLFTVSRSF